MFGWHDGEVWDLGHRRTGAVSQLGPHVLQGGPGRHRCLRYHQHSESRGRNCLVCRVSLFFQLARKTCSGELKFNNTVSCSFLCSKDTFTRAKNWVKELQRQASPNIVIALAGNKADLANKRAIDFQVTRSHVGVCISFEDALMPSGLFVCLQEAQGYADDNSLLFMETSAKTAMNVNEIFMAIGTCSTHFLLLQQEMGLQLSWWSSINSPADYYYFSHQFIYLGI